MSERIGENGASTQAGSPWDALANYAAQSEMQQEQESNQEALDIARRTRKVLACYKDSVEATDPEANTRALRSYDIPMDEAARDEILQMVAEGRAGTREQKQEVLDSIIPPVYFNPEESYGALAKMSQEADGRPLKIFSYMMTGDLNGGYPGPDSLMQFLRRFNDPMAFEEQRNKFLNKIEKQNSAQKRKVYEQAMDVFSHVMYGHRQDYWEVMKGIDEEAQKKFGSKAESERGYEWLRGDFGYGQISRMQVARGEAQRENFDKGLTADGACEDSMLIDNAQQLYAVFDGAGGMGNGRLASTTAARFLMSQTRRGEIRNSMALADIMERMNDEVLNTPGIGQGCTTATVARVIQQGEHNELVFASVGDSRIYIVDKDGKARQITRDEGFENKITNAIGFERSASNMSGVPNPVCRQYGAVPLHEGDRVMICSDGITGDKGTDLMSDREVGQLVHDASNATDAARRLLTGARKRDDRSAIVFTAR